MTDAPERIWAFYAPDIEEDNPKCNIVAGDQVMHGAQQYIRADLHAELMRAADSLAGAVDQERNMTCQDFGMQLKASEVVGAALTAYQQSKEKLRL
ncbi:MAG: hypothetical protein GY820_16075 [Gammaproteobacteria bacterium]|nr:hypothetical protein [Gammaproteobacteria bacterium]